MVVRDHEAIDLAHLGGSDRRHKVEADRMISYRRCGLAYEREPGREPGSGDRAVR